MSGTIRRRVWTAARAVPDEEAGFRIMLDARPLRLPGGAMLRPSSRALAEAVAIEWSEAGGGAVGGVFGPDALVLTRLAGTLQERVAPARPRAIAMLRGYADNDLLCYRATHPAVLVERQQAAWQPWLDWAARRHDAPLVVTHGVMPVSQPQATLAALQVALEAQDDAGLTGLGILVPALGSLVLGLAVADGALDAPSATELALLDELQQLEQWGADAEATDRHRMLAQEIADAAHFITLARDTGG